MACKSLSFAVQRKGQPPWVISGFLRQFSSGQFEHGVTQRDSGSLWIRW
ncbi:hypothetical protein [Limnohabitans sp. TS-CS-82]|nr:hypothetical protein [Limnohabitans sp. TS-CS-82]